MREILNEADGGLMAKDDARWRRYLAYNRAIAEQIYGPHAAGRPVYLDLEDELLKRVVAAADPSNSESPKDALFGAVRDTLSIPPAGHGSIFSAHTLRLLFWEGRQNSDPPPCLALLAFFSLVAEGMQTEENLSSSNYYDRLMAALGLGPDYKAQLQQEFRRNTPAFWDALNDWLEQSDGLRGIPTAYAFDRRRYVGLPISQALVRDQDRRRLPQMFLEYGLQPHQRLAVGEMQQYLEDWLPSSSVTPSLKTLWRKQDSKPKIAEVVCVELEAWTGTVDTGDGRVRATEIPLLLAAEISTRPIHRVEFLIGVRSGSQPDSGPYEPNMGVKGADAVFRDCPDSLDLLPVGGADLLLASPQRCLSVPDILLSHVKLRSKSSGTVLSRRAKGLVLLRFDERENLFKEVSRVELVEQYLILIYKPLADSVLSLLKEVARPGFTVYEPAKLKGLPEGWVAIDNLQIERAGANVSLDLKPLVPTAKAHIAVGTGLSLPGYGVWHVDVAPELVIATDQPDQEMIVSAHPIRRFDDGALNTIELSEVRGSGVIELSYFREKLSEGDYRVVVDRIGSRGRKRTPVTSLTLRLRSGSNPRYVAPDSECNLGRLLNGTGLPLISASPLPNSEAVGEFAALTGARLIGNFPLPARSEVTHQVVSLPEVPGAVYPEEANDLDAASEDIPPQAATTAPDCLVRGYHYWICDPMDPTQLSGGQPIRMVCRDCGLEKWREPRPRGRRRRTTQASPVPAAAHQARTHLPAVSDRRSVDMDTLLDALTYARVGPWRSLVTMASQIDDSLWFAGDVARRLSALGHIEVSFDPDMLLPASWSISPCTLAPLPGTDDLLLAGARSRHLLTALSTFSSALGGRVILASTNNSPAVVTVSGVSQDYWDLLTEEVATATKLDFALSPQPSLAILDTLPDLASMLGELPTMTVEVDNPERFDVESGKWVRAKDVDQPGAYRIQRRPVRYAFVSAAAEPLLCDAWTAKYLAAWQAGIALIGYEFSHQRLLVPAGAHLPGLIERAAVLCSGRLPGLVNGSMLAYENIPPEVAQEVWRIISGSNTSGAQQ